MKRHIRLTILGTVIVTCLSAVAAATDLLLLLPGFPGTTEQAQPYVDQMLRYLETDMGETPFSMKGIFIPDGADAAERLASVKPGIALMEPSVYAMSQKTQKMQVIARVHANGRGEQTYYVVTRKDGAANLKALSGKTMSGVVVHDPKYVFNVLLDKKAPTDIRLVSQGRPLKSLRDVHRGDADAALIDQDAKDHMSELEFASDLQIIHTSAPVPAPAVVVLNDGRAKADAIRKSLVGLCDRPEGKDLCRSLTLTAVIPASDKDYRPLLAKYNR